MSTTVGELIEFLRNNFQSHLTINVGGEEIDLMGIKHLPRGVVELNDTLVSQERLEEAVADAEKVANSKGYDEGYEDGLQEGASL